MGDRGRDGWMASSTQWTWVSVNSGRWWRTGKPGVLLSMGSRESNKTWWLNNSKRLGLSSSTSVTSQKTEKGREDPCRRCATISEGLRLKRFLILYMGAQHVWILEKVLVQLSWVYNFSIVESKQNIKSGLFFSPFNIHPRPDKILSWYHVFVSWDHLRKRKLTYPNKQKPTNSGFYIIFKCWSHT